MKHYVKSNDSLREKAFFAALIVNAVVFPFSEALISVAAGLMLIQMIIFRSWKHPSVKHKSSDFLILFPVSVFLIYLTGSLFTEDISLAFYELKKNIFWLVVPLAICFSPKLPPKNLYLVFFFFVSAVLVSSVVITGKLLFYESFRLAEFRELSIISHIRFSLQVGFAIIILMWLLIRRKYIDFKLHPAPVLTLLVWLSLFLFLLKSLVGIVALAGTAVIGLLHYANHVKKLSVKIPVVLFLAIVIIFPIIYIGKVFYDFYDFKETDPDAVEMITPSGNPYHHDFTQKIRENGHLVYVYINEDELRKEWNKRSEIKYDDDLNGYPLGSTLIRYLASYGYRKDSTGVNKLTNEDVALIEQGATNYRFNNHFLSLYPRIYETIWEIDQYLRTNDPNNKTVAQRIEYIKASLLLVKKNPVFGVGTGNWMAAYDDVYHEMNTKLSPENRSPSHNQYLNYIVKFGILGFVWIMFAIIFPVFKKEHHHNFIFVFLLVFIAIANFGDANLETHTGLSFFIFFYSLLLWNSSDIMKRSILNR